VKHEKHFAIRLENLAQQIRRLRRPPVFSVSRRVTPIRLLQRGPSFRTNSGVIIARKLPPLGSVFAHGPKTALPAPKANPPAPARKSARKKAEAFPPPLANCVCNDLLGVALAFSARTAA